MKYILKSFVIYMIFTSNAFAYIDPGIGSIILQGIIASIAAVGVFFGIAPQRLGVSLSRAVVLSRLTSLR